MDVRSLRDEHESVCRFCSVLTRAGNDYDSPWLAEDSYKAIVSVGALVPGWTLVCPVDHSLNLLGHYRRSGFWDFASTAANVVQRRYGSCAFFEHGANQDGSLTGCGVGHAHGHIVPLAFSLEDEVHRTAPELNWKRCRATDIATIANGKEYLFVASVYGGPETLGSLCVLESPISQFVRRVIACRLGVGDLYDYNKYPMLEIVRATARELREDADALVRV